MSGRSVDLVTFGLDGITREHRPFEHGIALHPKRPSGVKANVPPASLRKGRRIMPWESAVPILGAFANDGEAINFRAGPMHDWRAPLDGVTPDNPEHTEAMREKLQNDLIVEIDEEAGFAALMDDSGFKRTSLGQHMVTLTYLAVLFVGVLMVVSLLQKGDGINNFLPGGQTAMVGGFLSWQSMKRAGGSVWLSIKRSIGRKIRWPWWARYALDAASVEPRVAIGIGLLGVAYLTTTGLVLYTGVVEQHQAPFTLAVFTLFGLVVTTGCMVFLLLPLVWPRLWMKRAEITPDGIHESYVNPAARKRYGPDYVKGRLITVVKYPLWGEPTIAWAHRQGYHNGEMPMPSQRRSRIISPVDVANHANQEDLRQASHVPELSWEKPVQYMALFGIIGVALFIGLAIIDSAGKTAGG